MKVALLAAVLLDFEVAREAVEGSFVLDAEAAHAVEEEGLLCVVVLEELEGEGSGGGGGWVTGLDLGYGGVGDGAFPGFDAAEDPVLLGDAEYGEFFGGRGGLVSGDHLLKEPVEVVAGLMLVDAVVAEEGGVY